VSQTKAKVLIIGNELSLGESIKQVLINDGYEAFHILHPDESQAVLNNHRIDIMLVDCMLPRISGVDFVEGLRTTYPSLKIKIILMSGIYTDKNFIQEATKRTQAMAFIKKELPFDHSQVLDAINKISVSNKVETPARRLLYQIFSKEKVTSREKRKLIESLEEVSGFDLPFIYSLLVETKSSGYLNIYEKSGSVSGISFSSGNIVGVDVEDKTTYLGELLIQSGYATPLDVQNAVKDKSNMRLGQKLIKANLLSPHAFDLALSEQMNIRLSRTIVDQTLRINFAVTDVDLSSPCIDSDQLLSYLHDWIVSKLTLGWLKSLYMLWSGHSIVKTSAFRPDHPALQMSMIKQLDGFMVEIENGTSINKILSEKKFNEAAAYKALHFLLTKGLIVFSNVVSFKSPEEQLAAVKKVAADFKGRTPFEILNLLNITRSDEGSEANLLTDFLRMIGPEPAPQLKELSSQWKMVRQLFDEAIQRIGDTNMMDQMKAANQTREAEQKLKATQIVEEVKQLLLMNMYTKAYEKLNEALRLSAQVPQVYVFLAWAKLGQLEPGKKIVNLKDIEFDLMQVPAEERYDVYFPFVTGLFQKSKGDFNSAKKSFEKACAVDNSFIPARREISLLSSSAKKADVLNMDLTKMVSGFFRKKG
jgi:CheY-like chemotaxis protein